MWIPCIIISFQLITLSLSILPYFHASIFSLHCFALSGGPTVRCPLPFSRFTFHFQAAPSSAPRLSQAPYTHNIHPFLFYLFHSSLHPFLLYLFHSSPHPFSSLFIPFLSSFSSLWRILHKCVSFNPFFHPLHTFLLPRFSVIFLPTAHPIVAPHAPPCTAMQTFLCPLCLKTLIRHACLRCLGKSLGLFPPIIRGNSLPFIP